LADFLSFGENHLLLFPDRSDTSSNSTIGNEKERKKKTDALQHDRHTQKKIADVRRLVMELSVNDSIPPKGERDPEQPRYIVPSVGNVSKLSA
jgi:hypothetical protein